MSKQTKLVTIKIWAVDVCQREKEGPRQVYVTQITDCTGGDTMQGSTTFDGACDILNRRLGELEAHATFRQDR